MSIVSGATFSDRVCAILAIPADNVTGITIKIQWGEPVKVDVTMLVIDRQAGELIDTMMEYELTARSEGIEEA